MAAAVSGAAFVCLRLFFCRIYMLIGSICTSADTLYQVSVLLGNLLGTSIFSNILLNSVVEKIITDYTGPVVSELKNWEKIKENEHIKKDK